MRPAVVATVIAVVFEVPICIFLSLWGMDKFAYYISNSEDVAAIVKKMWQVSILPSGSNAQRHDPVAILTPRIRT